MVHMPDCFELIKPGESNGKLLVQPVGRKTTWLINWALISIKHQAGSEMYEI